MQLRQLTPLAAYTTRQMGECALRPIVATVFAISLALSGPALGQGNGNGNGNGNGHKSQNQTSGQSSAAGLTGSLITSFERSTILGYIQNHQEAPEFAGMKPLPPGIAKKVARGGSLPPGIAKRYFPSDLTSQLPPRPGQQWLVLGTDILLIDAATQIILDVLHQ